jgi:hypothetical protein
MRISQLEKMLCRRARARLCKQGLCRDIDGCFRYFPAYLTVGYTRLGVPPVNEEFGNPCNAIDWFLCQRMESFDCIERKAWKSLLCPLSDLIGDISGFTQPTRQYVLVA